MNTQIVFGQPIKTHGGAERWQRCRAEHFGDACDGFSQQTGEPPRIQIARRSDMLGGKHRRRCVEFSGTHSKKPPQTMNPSGGAGLAGAVEMRAGAQRHFVLTQPHEPRADRCDFEREGRPVSHNLPRALNFSRMNNRRRGHPCARDRPIIARSFVW